MSPQPTSTAALARAAATIKDVSSLALLVATSFALAAAFAVSTPSWNLAFAPTIAPTHFAEAWPVHHSPCKTLPFLRSNAIRSHEAFSLKGKGDLGRHSGRRLLLFASLKPKLDDFDGMKKAIESLQEIVEKGNYSNLEQALKQKDLSCKISHCMIAWNDIDILKTALGGTVEISATSTADAEEGVSLKLVSTMSTMDVRSDETEERATMPSIDDGTSDDLDAGQSQVDPAELLDLSPLEPLYARKEQFFPKKIYIRECMRTLFRLYIEEKSPPESFGTVLIGSPGVGKSVLFFLAALCRSQETLSAYYRRVKALTERSSFFVMFPDANKKGVHVVFSRTLRGEGSLTSLDLVLCDCLHPSIILQREDYYTFIDGPKHNDEANTLLGKYDFFCTSGGHPPPKSEQKGSFRLWALDAWSQKDAIDALVRMGNKQDAVEQAYWVCGGCIRDMIRGLQDGFKDLKSDAKQDLSFYTADEPLVLETTERSDNQRDRFRRMFRTYTDDTSMRMSVVQIVDSQYLLQLIAKESTMKPFLDGYKLARRIDSGTAQGVFFELIVHTWFTKTPKPVGSVCWSQGTGAQGVLPFQDANVYWIPSVCNFPAIDSAILVGDVLHVLQMTIRDDHSFTYPKFEELFLDPAKEKFVLSSIDLHMVVPSGGKMKLESIKEQFPPSGTEPSLPHVVLPITEVDVTTEDTVDASLRKLSFIE